MRPAYQPEPLAALKAFLHDLKDAKLMYPGDISIVRLRRNLMAKIAELENRQKPTVSPRFR
jgi:hypothetical protein